MSSSNQQITKFVKDVRDALSDLPPTTVAALTDDLDIELAERNQEGQSVYSLGSPESFAKDLRESAGVTAPSRGRSALASTARALSKSALRFAASLAPVWWVLRALIGYDFVRMLFGHDFHAIPDADLAWEWWLIAICVFVSAQFGRGVWGFRRTAWLVTSANVLLAVLLLPFALLTNDALENASNNQGLLDSNTLIAQGYLVFEPRALDKNGALLPMASLTDRDGNEIYKATDGTPDEFKALIGMSKEQATKQLLESGYEKVLVDYTLAVDVAKGTVISVDAEPSASGGEIVKLTVSKGSGR